MSRLLSIAIQSLGRLKTGRCEPTLPTAPSPVTTHCTRTSISDRLSSKFILTAWSNLERLSRRARRHLFRFPAAGTRIKLSSTGRQGAEMVSSFEVGEDPRVSIQEGQDAAPQKKRGVPVSIRDG